MKKWNIGLKHGNDNKEKADRLVTGIYKKAQILKRFPKIGHRYKIITEGYVRILMYGHYRITYLIKDDENIDILGIFHDALNISRYLSY